LNIIDNNVGDSVPMPPGAQERTIDDFISAFRSVPKIDHADYRVV